MKVVYSCLSSWPSDVAKPQAASSDRVVWFRTGDLPFVPTIGMWIDCGDGNPRRVEDCGWSAERPDTIKVYLGDEGDDFVRALSYWHSSGWKNDDHEALRHG